MPRACTPWPEDPRPLTAAWAKLSPEQRADIEAHVRGLTLEADTYDMPAGEAWRCFHCGSVFRTPGGARLHFGATPDQRPVCHPFPTDAELSAAANQVVQRVCEYDDRSSPEDWPEALLITGPELHSELLRFAATILGARP